MIGSGLALVIFDSRIVHKFIRKVRTRLRRNSQDGNMELGQDVPSRDAELAVETVPQDTKPVQIDISGAETSATRLSTSRQQDESNLTVENSRARIRSEEVKAPYSIMTGVSIFALFMISFITIMVIRGVVGNLPKPYQLFANMYLAGNFSSYEHILKSFRNNYLWYSLS